MFMQKSENPFKLDHDAYIDCKKQKIRIYFKTRSFDVY